MPVHLFSELVRSGTIAFGVAAFLARPLMAADVMCPPRLPGPHPGFEQVGPVPAAHWLLHRMRLFDVTPARQTNGAATEVHPERTVEGPDSFISTWHFAGSEDLEMICTYNGSGTYYRARLPASPSDCTIRDDNGLRLAWCVLP
jgi:hypothetical protein